MPRTQHQTKHTETQIRNFILSQPEVLKYTLDSKDSYPEDLAKEKAEAERSTQERKTKVSASPAQKKDAPKLDAATLAQLVDQGINIPGLTDSPEALRAAGSARKKKFARAAALNLVV